MSGSGTCGRLPAPPAPGSRSLRAAALGPGGSLLERGERRRPVVGGDAVGVVGERELARLALRVGLLAARAGVFELERRRQLLNVRELLPGPILRVDLDALDGEPGA